MPLSRSALSLIALSVSLSLFGCSRNDNEPVAPPPPPESPPSQAPAAPAMTETVGASLNNKQVVDLSAVPPEVLQAAAAVRPDLSVAKAESEQRDGVTYYDVEGTLKDGSEFELDIMQAETGWKVVEAQRDIAEDALPAPVKATLLDAVPDIKPARIIESDQLDGVIIYEVFAVDSTGAESKHEVKWDGTKAEYLKEEWPH